MNANTLYLGRAYRVSRDSEEFWNEHAPDENWSFVDQAGHAHRHARGADPYPTLARKSEAVEDWDEDGEDASCTREWFECRECGEVIRPGTTTRREVVAGLTRYEVDGEPVTKDEFDRMLAEDRAGRHPR